MGDKSGKERIVAYIFLANCYKPEPNDILTLTATIFRGYKQDFISLFIISCFFFFKPKICGKPFLSKNAKIFLSSKMVIRANFNPFTQWLG